ncbi:MAG: hypothetical protein WCT24_02005 [Patescibacteria group bacterium]|jgi:hypothetical protein
MKTKNTSARKKTKGNEFFFDDCPICQAVKKMMEEDGLVSEKKLKAAFKEANSPKKKKGM